MDLTLWLCEFLTGGKVIDEDKKRRRSKNSSGGDTRISVKGSRVAIQYAFYYEIWSDTIALQLVKTSMPNPDTHLRYLLQV